MRPRILVPVILATVFCVAQADADIYGFTCITSNSTTDASIGEAQLSMQVSSVLGQDHQALFTFLNTGPNASSITKTYFDDGTLLGIANVINGIGVNFSQGNVGNGKNNNADLPGGTTIGFQTTAGFLATANPPMEPDGVNSTVAGDPAAESLGILFNLQSDKTYSDVINAIALGIAQGGVPGSLRIGVHVQGFASGGSESFVVGGSRPAVPAPPAVVLCFIGLGVASVMKKRQLIK